MINYQEPKTVEEKQWQAESDARTLAEAEMIMSDEKRLERAKKAATKMAENAKREAEAMDGLRRMKYPKMEKDKE